MSTRSPRRFTLALALAAAPLATLLPTGLPAQAPLAPVLTEAAPPATASVAPVAPKREGTVTPAARRPVRRERDRLAYDEIRTTLHANVFSLIRAERPLWLHARGRSSLGVENAVKVYYGAVLLGGPEVLQRMSCDGIREIRHLDSRDATVQYGNNHSGGAILLVPGT